jgi:hypothetical protein
MRLLLTTKAGAFTGEEFGPTEAIFSFESRKPATILFEIRSILASLGLLSGSFIVIREDPIPGDSDLCIPMEDLDTWPGRLEQVAAAKRKARARRPMVNDYYAVPLPDGRFGHLQYVHKDRKWGDFVQVLTVIMNQPVGVEELINAKPLFPPVMTPVAVGIRVGGWVFLGNRVSPQEFQFPTFRSTISLLLRRHEPGVYDDWWLWSGGSNCEFVGRLRADQRGLEYQVWWPPQELARRIATGENEYDRFF